GARGDLGDAGDDPTDHLGARALSPLLDGSVPLGERGAALLSGDVAAPVRLVLEPEHGLLERPGEARRGGRLSFLQLGPGVGPHPSGRYLVDHRTPPSMALRRAAWLASTRPDAASFSRRIRVSSAASISITRSKSSSEASSSSAARSTSLWARASARARCWSTTPSAPSTASMAAPTTFTAFCVTWRAFGTAAAPP